MGIFYAMKILTTMVGGAFFLAARVVPVHAEGPPLGFFHYQLRARLGGQSGRAKRRGCALRGFGDGSRK
jgi:hypothetical protein